MASPAPPGDLSPANAPQIVVFGWDDIESLPGVQFVTTLLGSVKNPAKNPNSNSTSATANLNANACYAYDSAYQCGDGSLSSSRSAVTSLLTTNGFAMANHTLDHLENYEANGGWSGIPTAFKDTTNGGWLPCSTGPAVGVCSGPACCMDQSTWETILPVNDSALKNDYSATVVQGFRAPRLEMNDNGLKALKSVGYQYDESLEEVQPPGYVAAAVDADTGGKHGFNWFPWPYTLDNGSPGVWNQQATASQQWLTDYPTGLWETPTYEVYVPSANGLGKTIAATMLKEDDPSNCTFPAGTPPDQSKHCFLSDGEIDPGGSITEVTGFDFNTFIYCRMTPDQWFTVLQHTFLLRYYGSRTPLTYGAHPMEYTEPYDSYTLGKKGCDSTATCQYSAGNPNNCCQANNFGYRDVVNFSTYTTRQQAMTKFVRWIQSDPVLSKDTYFMSAQDLVAYMQHPFDRTGTAVKPDAVATPDSNGIFNRLGWKASGAKLTVVSGNAADIAFTIPKPADGDNPAVVFAAAGVTKGALKGLSHIDVKYNSQVPFRIRLLRDDSTTTVTALLAGVGSDRVARIRIKDFFPGPEASESQIASMPLVDSSYMAGVTGIAFESAATQAAPTGTPGAFAGGTFTAKIEQITLHGATTAGLCTP
jgi:hypothetical protein